MYSSADVDAIAHEDINKTVVFNIPQTKKQVKSVQKNVHHMPIKIDYNGPAAVSSYFHPNPVVKYESSLKNTNITTEHMKLTHKGEHQYSSATFRGREVTGRSIALPVNTVGLIVELGAEDKSCDVQVRKIGAKKTDKPAETTKSEILTPNCTVTGLFSQFYVWNKDNEENPTDYISRSIEEFLPLVNALNDD